MHAAEGGGADEECSAPAPDAEGPAAGKRLPCPQEHFSDHLGLRATVELNL